MEYANLPGIHNMNAAILNYNSIYTANQFNWDICNGRICIKISIPLTPRVIIQKIGNRIIATIYMLLHPYREFISVIPRWLPYITIRIGHCMFTWTIKHFGYPFCCLGYLFWIPLTRKRHCWPCSTQTRYITMLFIAMRISNWFVGSYLVVPFT